LLNELFLDADADEVTLGTAVAEEAAAALLLLVLSFPVWRWIRMCWFKLSEREKRFEQD